MSYYATEARKAGQGHSRYGGKIWRFKKYAAKIFQFIKIKIMCKIKVGDLVERQNLINGKPDNYVHWWLGKMVGVVVKIQEQQAGPYIYVKWQSGEQDGSHWTRLKVISECK